MGLPYPSFSDATSGQRDAEIEAQIQAANAKGQFARAAGTAFRGNAQAAVAPLVAGAKAVGSGVGGFLGGVFNTSGDSVTPETKLATTGPSTNPQTAPAAAATPPVQTPTVDTATPNVPTPGGTDLGNGITRYDVKGESPLFTNLPQSDFATKRGNVLPSVPGFLNTVQDFGGGALPQASVGGTGLPTSNIDSRLASILDRSQSLLSSNSIVDNWRGRQLAKMHDRLLAGSVAQTNAASAQRQASVAEAHQLNEIPLAQLQSNTTRRGQDTALYPHLGTAGLSLEALKILQAGGPDAIERSRAVAAIGIPRFEPQDRAAHTTQTADGSLVTTDATDGHVLNVTTAAELAAMNKKKQQDAAAGLVKPNGK